jgi:hypothetical protein
MGRIELAVNGFFCQSYEPTVGFEPTTCCLQNSCSNQLSYVGIADGQNYCCLPPLAESYIGTSRGVGALILSFLACRNKKEEEKDPAVQVTERGFPQKSQGGALSLATRGEGTSRSRRGSLSRKKSLSA